MSTVTNYYFSASAIDAEVATVRGDQVRLWIASMTVCHVVLCHLLVVYFILFPVSIFLGRPCFDSHFTGADPVVVQAVAGGSVRPAGAFGVGIRPHGTGASHGDDST